MCVHCAFYIYIYGPTYFITIFIYYFLFLMYCLFICNEADNGIHTLCSLKCGMEPEYFTFIEF